MASKTYTAEEIEQLDKLKLIVKIVLEPKHDFVNVVQILDRPIALGEFIARLLDAPPTAVGDESRPLLAQCGEG